MKRLSLHIGLNQIDPAVYGEGNDLENCLNDCDYYTGIATANGFVPTVLKDEEATSARVISEFSKAASALGNGDYFLVTYAGHGSQVPDEDDEEDDGMNETWVLYDRQMVDNEIYRMWGNFNQGVKIFVLSDSCHSGTLMRQAMIQVKPVIRNLLPLNRTFRAVRKGARSTALNDKESIINLIRSTTREIKSESLAYKARDIVLAEKNRMLSIDASLQNYVNQRELYRTVMLLAGEKRDIFINATLIYISGCQDNQVSGDGPAGSNGIFTGNLKKTWNGGNFTGGYLDFYDRICFLMPMNQSPKFTKMGMDSAEYENEKPFSLSQHPGTVTEEPVESTKEEKQVTKPPVTPDNSTIPPVTETPAEKTYSISASVGQNGTNKKTDVELIQTLLKKLPDDEGGSNLTADGICGQKTIRAIKSFQIYYGYDSSNEFGIIHPGSPTFDELVWQVTFMTEYSSN